MKKEMLILLMVGFLIVQAFSFQANVNSSQANFKKTQTLPSVVKIGFLYPKTGGLGPIGQGILDGATAAAYRINQSNYGFKVVLVPADTQTDGPTSATQAQNLISYGVQVIVGAASSTDTLAASGVTIPNQVPLISYASTSTAITNLNDSDYVFRDIASDAYQGQALAKLAINQSIQHAFLLHMNNAYGNGIATEFIKEYSKLGYNVSGEITYDPSASSYSTEISTIKSSSAADGVVTISYPTDGYEILAEAQTQNLNIKWLGSDSIASISVTNNTAIKSYIDGTPTTTKLLGTTPSAAYNNAGTLYTQFIGDLKATSGFYGIYGDYAYDAVLLVGAAIHKAGTYDGTSIRDSLYAVANGFEGATNLNKAFNCAGGPISQSYDYWYADSTGSVSTLAAHAVSFTDLGTAATAPCGNQPYTGTFITSYPNTTSSPNPTTSQTNTTTPKITTTPGFEFISVGIVAMVVSTITRIRKR